MIQRRLKGWRTFIVNGVLAILPTWEAVALAMEFIATAPEIPSLLPVEWMPYYTILVTIVNLYMRLITTTPLGQSDKGDS